MFDLQSMMSAKCIPSDQQYHIVKFQSRKHTLYENIYENISTNTNEIIDINKKYMFGT